MSTNQLDKYKTVQLRYSLNSSSYHELFIREHSIRHREEDKPPGLTLFVLNIPPYADEVFMKNAFSQFGKVISVIFQETENSQCGFKKGYIIFSTRSGLLKCLEATKINVDELPVKTGLSKWINEYNNSIIKPDLLQKEINNFMKNLDKIDKNKDKTHAEPEIDDEGWTMVTKKGRNPGLARKESVTIKLGEKIKNSSNKKELKNFYTFQIREGKMKNLVKLRKNYEEAKRKVGLMKASRSFKPY